MEAEAEVGLVHVAVAFSYKQQQRVVGACVLSKRSRSSMEDNITDEFHVFEFMDNDQFSNLDSLLVQVGACQIFVANDVLHGTTADAKKIRNVLGRREAEVHEAPKSAFRTTDLNANIHNLIGPHNSSLLSIELELPLGLTCVGCLISELGLMSDESTFGSYNLASKSLTQYMRIDSPAADAVNLLPKANDGSNITYGSIYGVLNHCKTKMGERMLERWLRQPLVDIEELRSRQNVVQALKTNTTLRATLQDGHLKGLVDLDAIGTKLQKQKGGLTEVFRLYMFAKSLPGLISTLQEMNAENEEGGTEIQARFTEPLSKLSGHFGMYEKLVEHVIDLDKLPDLVVNPAHDEALAQIREQLDELEHEIDNLHAHASRTWASFTDLKLDADKQYGFIFRATRGSDQQKLEAANPKIKILSILKNGIHFTTPDLKAAAEQHQELRAEYEEKQQGLVEKALETASTYLPVLEAAARIIAELDVLVSFGHTAALAPKEYVRPVLHEQGHGVIRLVGARHPCVELMDDVSFIANDYELVRGESGFQIITGPNMGGKSTYIRGLGSIVVMAQVGSFVPCDSAEISIVDCILARVGAGDAQQKGISTFMAEMLEASVILQTATPNSLLIIDELGRGTSTFDGFGLAWAISEYILKDIGCFCLFATHFHELTTLAERERGVTNKHVTAHTEGGMITMLYTLQDGPCTQSFGIHVAEMAKFPPSVIEEAKRKASHLESLEHDIMLQDKPTEPADSNCAVQDEKRRRVYEAMERFHALHPQEMPAPELRERVASIVAEVETA